MPNQCVSSLGTGCGIADRGVCDFDVGADKPRPFVGREPEPNPALGMLAIRLSLRRPNLFENQLRAVLRAHGNRTGGGTTGIMFPLVSGWTRWCRPAEDEGIGLDGVEVDVIIEVPSAALAADRIAPLANLFSVGTNDLLQYLFVADRQVAELADVCEPLVLDLISAVVGAADRHGAWVGCVARRPASRRRPPPSSGSGSANCAWCRVRSVR